jgi:hypothetical protein
MQKNCVLSRSLCLILLAGGLAACGETNLVKDFTQGVGIGGEPRPAPDFVSRTRPANYEYLPVGESAPKRPIKAKDAAGLAKAEAEMDAARTRNEARGVAARNAASTTPPAEPVPAPPPAPAE